MSKFSIGASFAGAVLSTGLIAAAYEGEGYMNGIEHDAKKECLKEFGAGTPALETCLEDAEGIYEGESWGASALFLLGFVGLASSGVLILDGIRKEQP